MISLSVLSGSSSLSVSSTGLMVVGFGLKDSIMNIASLQYDNIQLYDAMAALNTDVL